MSMHLRILNGLENFIDKLNCFDRRNMIIYKFIINNYYIYYYILMISFNDNNEYNIKNYFSFSWSRGYN